MTRRGVTIGVAVILLLLFYFAAALLFNRTNPEREVRLIPVQQHLPFVPGPPRLMIYLRGGR